MLIEFTANNFKSIKNTQALSLKPASKFSSKDHEENLIDPTSNFYGISLLKSAVVFGGNASGKSNLLKGLQAVQFLVENSMEFKLDEDIVAYEPFKLCRKCENKSITFSIDFIAKNGFRYFYLIEFDQKKFIREELYFYPKTSKTRKTVLFQRNDKTKFGIYYEGTKDIELYDNQLILSKVANQPIKSLIEPYRFFSNYLFCSTIHDTRYDDSIIRSFSSLMQEGSSQFRSNINKLLRAADTEIEEVVVKEYSENEFKFPEDIPDKVKEELIEKYKHRIKTVHKVYEDDDIIDNKVFDLREESTGTIKLLVVGGLILDALQDGTTITIDELDKSLHPLLTQMLIGLFNSEENNPHNAQLIFATHDVYLINREIFRLDQIMFSQKDFKGISTYFKLSEFTNISKLAPLAKWYLLGRFGATPMINEFELSLDLNNPKEYETETIH